MIDEKWRSIALQQIDKPSEAMAIITSLGIAGGVAFVAGTGLGALALLIGTAYTITRGDAATKQEEAITNHGCYAISLGNTRLQEYIKEVGVQQVFQELSWANENGYRLSDVADDWLESHIAGKSYKFEKEFVPLSEYKTTPLDTFKPVVINFEPSDSPKPPADRKEIVPIGLRQTLKN
jgi:hypothetical protein